MKTIKGKLKLNQFNKTELEQRALNAIRGGNRCGCENGGGCKMDGCNFYDPSNAYCTHKDCESIVESHVPYYY